MSEEEKRYKSDEEALMELRKEASIDPGGTTLDGAQLQREMKLPVDKELYLEVMDGPYKGLQYKFPKGNITIGRTDEADFVLEDDKISRKHAVIEAFGRDLIFIADLASTNGTFVNDMQVRTVKLKDGDLIKVGKTSLKFITKDM